MRDLQTEMHREFQAMIRYTEVEFRRVRAEMAEEREELSHAIEEILCIIDAIRPQLRVLVPSETPTSTTTMVTATESTPPTPAAES